jgi:hypothetical protein
MIDKIAELNREAEEIRKIVVKQIESVEKMPVTDALDAACRFFAIENLKLVLEAIDERLDDE